MPELNCETEVVEEGEQELNEQMPVREPRSQG